MARKKTWFFNSPQLYRIAAAAAARIPAERGDRHGGQEDALVAIVFAALALEAFVNEFGKLAADETYWDPRVTTDLSALAAAYRSAEHERGSLELKLHVVRIALRGGSWPRGQGAFQQVVLLLRLRNELVHLKLDVREGDARSADAGSPPGWLKQLTSARILSSDSGTQRPWTHCVGTRAAARWACTAVARMVEETIALVSPGQFREDVVRYFRLAFDQLPEKPAISRSG
jgi:hypothetical protein